MKKKTLFGMTKEQWNKSTFEEDVKQAGRWLKRQKYIKRHTKTRIHRKSRRTKRR